MDAVEKIRVLLDKQNKTQLELASFLGESQSTLNKWISKNEKNRRDIPNTVLLKIANFLNVSPYYLLGLEEFEVGKEANNVLLLDKINLRAGAGSGGYVDLPIETTKIAIDKTAIPAVKGLNLKHLKVIEIIGDSMEDEYYEGDFAVIDMVNGRHNFTKINGNYVVRVADIIYIKKVEFLPGNKIKLISLNKLYGDMYPHKEGYDYEILGKVCGKIHFSKGLFFDNQGIE
jgi:phage repressor protein C with HTH and peptisase S24 domain